MSSRFARYLSVLCMALLWAAGSTPAFAFTEGKFVNVTLEGCRNDGTITLPIGGKFVCPDAAYTTGNLGKGWNELDLVPHRLTTTLGSQSTATTDYNVYVAGDGITSGKVGWDVVSVPVVNIDPTKSDASCSVSAGAQLTLGDAINPFGGGTDTVIYRELTIHQNKGTTCVFDYYQRLALGSHLYPGSSLQSYLAVQENLNGSKKTISIPVNEILPQSLDKDMTATDGTSNHTWSILKEPTANTLSFGDVCAQNAPSKVGVNITVKWTKSPAEFGMITVTTHVYATNPAARVITTSVTDVIYSGTTELDKATDTKVVPANTANFLILVHSFAVPANTTDLNDIATATYTDSVTEIPIPGYTTATASALVQVTELNATANISDLEGIGGTGLTFSVAQPVLGGFLAYPTSTDPAYVADTPTRKRVSWGVMDQNGDGSVTFDKTVYLDGKRITTGWLADVASLVGSDGFAATTPVVKINISSTATATLTIKKSYSELTIANGERLVFNFQVTSTTLNPAYSKEVSIEVSGSGASSGSGEVSLYTLTPDAYSVTEGDTFFYPVGCTDLSVPACKLVVPMTPEGGTQRTVHLEPVDGIATCSGKAEYANKPSSTVVATAQVQKITVPETSTGAWNFELKSGTTTIGTASATANKGYVDFNVALAEGTYTVIETEQPPEWALTSGVPNDKSNTKVCWFQVDLPQDGGRVFQCTFTNTQQGKAQVIKTQSGGVPTQAFTFQLRQGASTTAVGTTLETLTTSAGNGTLNFSTWLVPGATYQMCEIVMPGWMTTLGTFVPNSFNPPDGVAPNPTVDNSILCGNFTVTPGQTLVFTIDNTPPPGGRALTIGFWKNWASCKKSGGNQAPVLDQTMAKAEPTGIQVDSFYLHGSTANPNVAPDCAKAVSLLSKQNFAGKNMASDPLFNMAAQLVAAELNLTAGAYTCPAVANAVNQANALLTKYSFNGTGYTGKLSSADATLANNLAKKLDDYNNNRPSACP